MFSVGSKALLLASTCFVGCAVNPSADSAKYAPTMPLPPVPVEQMNGSLYQDNNNIVLFEDARAHRVGDILTILVTEKTSGSKSASANNSKESSIELTDPVFLGRSPSTNVPGSKGADLSLEMGIDSKQDFKGAGDSSLKNALNGQIAVTIAEVLANGYLVIRGEKQVTINHGNEFIRISGIVRPRDIQPDNTVLSTLVADAKITYTGEGDAADSTRMGFLSRFFNQWWPF